MILGDKPLLFQGGGGSLTTHLVVSALNKHIIDAEIVNGTHAGDRVFIPRIPMFLSEDLSLSFKFKRKQFPMRLSFTMTINKAQG
jgi:ATP-dependent DNA helicase PIF1